MINNQNIAVLSEKVAALEAAIKNAGIKLPSVTTDDNGKGLQVVNGAWATGSLIPGVINALDSTSTTDALSAAQGKALDEKITGLIRKGTITNTTNSSGSIVISSQTFRKILGIVITATSSTDNVISIGYTDDGTSFVNIKTQAGANVTSTEFTFDYYYIE